MLALTGLPIPTATNAAHHFVIFLYSNCFFEIVRFLNRESRGVGEISISNSFFLLYVLGNLYQVREFIHADDAID